MSKNTEQFQNTYENGVKVLTEALKSETVLKKLGTSIFSVLDKTKKAAQQIVTERTVKDPDSFDFAEIESVDKLEKALRKNEIAKALLEGGFAKEDAAFENKQNGKSNSNNIVDESDEEIIPDF